jgi:MinD superfamily P-loop ATPase
MKEIVVISGKGGTGKTTVAAAFAALVKNAVLADCDVDAANLHLLLSPRIRKREDFSGGSLAVINVERCIGCGKCLEVCNFNAPALNGPANDVVQKTYTIDPVACEGCSVCTYFCPDSAIAMSPSLNGQWFISDTRFGTMVHARLGIAQENSGKLVTLIRKQAKAIAESENRELVIIDGSPGIGCPVIASITGVDLVLAVTEPSVSAQSDLKRVLELACHFNIPAAVCVNKHDINPAVTSDIEKMAGEMKCAVLGRIDYDPAVTKAQIQARTVIENKRQPVAGQIENIWRQALDILYDKKETKKRDAQH